MTANDMAVKLIVWTNWAIRRMTSPHKKSMTEQEQAPEPAMIQSHALTTGQSLLLSAFSRFLQVHQLQLLCVNEIYALC